MLAGACQFTGKKRWRRKNALPGLSACGHGYSPQALHTFSPLIAGLQKITQTKLWRKTTTASLWRSPKLKRPSKLHKATSSREQGFRDSVGNVVMWCFGLWIHNFWIIYTVYITRTTRDVLNEQVELLNNILDDFFKVDNYIDQPWLRCFSLLIFVRNNTFFRLRLWSWLSVSLAPSSCLYSGSWYVVIHKLNYLSTMRYNSKHA